MEYGPLDEFLMDRSAILDRMANDRRRTVIVNLL